MIGDTASISLLTGLPGSGKSLRLAQAICTLVEKGCHVYHCNIDGLNVPGTTPWSDPHKWQDLPPGAILFVDEAQHFFPARRGGDPVETVRMMSTIRHDGVRLVLATQQPNYLDTYLRGLVGYHEHLLRKSGKEASFIFRNNQIIDEVRAALPRIKALYDYENWNFPKKYFAAYKSAEIHTVRYQMPALLKKALMFGPVALALFAGAFYFVFRDSSLAHASAPESKAAASPPPATGAPGASPVGGNEVRTVEQYVEMHTPRIPTIPGSAPIFDKRQVVSDPQLFCMEGAAGADASGDYKDTSCTCITEQATPYALSDKECRMVARQGAPYNPYRRPQQATGGGGQAPTAMDANAAASSSGSVISPPQMSGYGDIGVGRAESAPR